MHLLLPGIRKVSHQFNYGMVMNKHGNNLLYNEIIVHYHHTMWYMLYNESYGGIYVYIETWYKASTYILFFDQ